MSELYPEGESLRKAVRWIDEMRKESSPSGLSHLIEEACLRFDLSPTDAEFLQRFFQREGKATST